MNKILNAILFFNCLFLSQAVPAEIRLFLGNYSRCTAYDAENKEWIVDSGYEISAINKALDACKKQSNIPTSCKINKETCESFVNGVSTRAMWRCTALDRMAKTWPSAVFIHRDAAALGAKANCQKGSSIPDTCYINTVTCINLNLRE